MNWAGNFRTWVRYAVILTLLLGSSLPAWSHNEPAVTPLPLEASPHEGQALQPWVSSSSIPVIIDA